MLHDHSFLKQQAIDETKRRGDPLKAIALALLYLAEAIRAK